MTALHITIIEPNKITIDNFEREDATDHERETADALEEYLVAVFTSGPKGKILQRLGRTLKAPKPIRNNLGKGPSVDDIAEATMDEAIAECEAYLARKPAEKRGPEVGDLVAEYHSGVTSEGCEFWMFRRWKKSDEVPGMYTEAERRYHRFTVLMRAAEVEARIGGDPKETV